MKFLLAQPVENSSNNLSYQDLGINPDRAPIMRYGSLNASAPTAENAPNVENLIGPDKYTGAEKDKAKLFISYLLQSTPAPKSFQIPEKGRGDKTTMYLPISDGDEPYTTIQISTKPRSSGSLFSSSGESEYDRMVKYLKSNYEYFQKYKMKTRSASVLRSLYLDSIFNIFEERNARDGEKSLVEKEKEAALAGLDKEYYDDLKNKSVADVNLEMLHAINKLNYFMYKLHQDNEKSSLLIAANGLKTTTADATDEMKFLKPISTMIKKKCWNLNEPGFPDDDKDACRNPAMAGIMGMIPR